MADKRRQNNQSLAQRRASIYNRRKRAPRTKKTDLLAKAKNVLRRTGQDVFGAQIDSPRFKGLVMVDGRKLPPEVIIERAEIILLREHRRNTELRAQHGLEALPLKTLKDL